MLLRKRLYVSAGFLLVFILIYLLFLICRSQDQYRHIFKSNMELSFSEITGSKVSIEQVSGNPFRKIFFKGMLFDFGKYKIDFDWASLEYSLLDILSNKMPETGIKETVLSLGRGSLMLENSTIISEGISGKIRLRQGSIVLDEIYFTVFDQLSGRLDGEISTNTYPYRVELSLDAKSIFDKKALIFEGLRMLVTGPLDNLSVRGKAVRQKDKDLHFSVYSIYENGIFTIGSRIGIEAEGADINHILSADTTIEPDKSRFNSILTLNTGKISVQGKYDDSGQVSVEFKNQQLEIFGQAISNIIYCNFKTVFRDNEISHFLVDLNTEASIINYWPVSELEASLIIDPKNIRVVYVKIGDTLSVSGFFGIIPPKKLSLNITFANFVLEEFLDLLVEDRPEVSGILSGSIYIEGPWEGPEARIRLFAENGNIGDISYSKMLVHANGVWPHLKMIDSRITHKGGSSLNMDGELDMRRFGSRYLMEDIVVSTTDNTIVWEGWDITRIDESREFLLQRSLGSGVRLGYKICVANEIRYEPVKQRDEFQLEYNLFDDDSVLEFRARESEEFFGIKKRYKF